MLFVIYANKFLTFCTLENPHKIFRRILKVGTDETESQTAIKRFNKKVERTNAGLKQRGFYFA